MTERDPLMSVRNLTKHYPVTEGVLKREVGRVRAVDGIDFDLYPGETLGLVGESGCGKSTAATSLLRLEDPTDGEVRFGDDEVTAYSRQELKRFRRRAQMVFQDPTSSFDPRMSIGESVAEPLTIHGMRDRDRRRAIVEDLLERVGMNAGDYDRYPHEFSGGQKQRVALARALVLNPELIVADEPVSALDVSIQASILQLIQDIQDEFGLSILLISHDMGVVRQICDRVAVMYLGEIVEIGPTETLFSDPNHPYTQALMSSIPTPDPRRRGQAVELSGSVPSPSNPPSGCRFHTRCPKVIPPDGVDLEQAEFRKVMDLRQRIASRDIDLETMRAFLADDEELEPATVDDASLEDRIREEFDLGALSDRDAEATVAEAIAAFVDDEQTRASELLRGAFESVCETDRPVLRTDWLGIDDLARAVSDGGPPALSLDEIRQTAAASSSVDPGALDDATLAAAVREQYGISDPLDDPEAERTVSDAIGAVVAGDRERAARLLDGLTLHGVPVGEGPGSHRGAACHLLEEPTPGVEMPSQPTE